MKQLGVLRIVKPRQYWNSVLRVEDVGGRRVVQDQGFVELTAEATQVFHITALIEDARFTEETSPKHTALIQQVRHRVCILSKASSEQNTFKQFPHPLEKLIHVWPLQHIYLVCGPLNLHRHNEICIAYWLKGAVHQCFIQIYYHTDLPLVLRGHFRQQTLAWYFGKGPIVLRL